MNTTVSIRSRNRRTSPPHAPGAGSAAPASSFARVGDLIRRAASAPAVTGLIVGFVGSPIYRPDSSSAPGKAVIQDLLNTVAFFCVALALAAFAIGAATWGIGGRLMHSSSGAAAGKMTMLAATGGAILLGAGPAIIAWALVLGRKA